MPIVTISTQDETINVTASALVIASGTLTGLNTWYVNINGNDSNSGSESSPLLTITEALSQSSANDVIYVMSGIYDETVTIDKNISIIGISEYGTSLKAQVTAINISTGVSYFLQGLSLTTHTVTLNAGGSTAEGIYKFVESDTTTFTQSGGAPIIIRDRYCDLGNVTISGGVVCLSKNTDFGALIFSSGSPTFSCERNTIQSLQNNSSTAIEVGSSFIAELLPSSANIQIYDTVIRTDSHTGVGAGTLTTDNQWENELGNPASDNYILQSLADGTRSWVAKPTGSAPSVSDEEIAALVTTSDGDVASASGISGSPLGKVKLLVNGKRRICGNGVKTKDYYWSTDGGTTALAFNAVVLGAKPYWNGTIAGFELAVTDILTFDYNV